MDANITIEQQKMTSSEPVPLYEIPRGSCVMIMDTPGGRRRSQLIRLGLVKGELIRCLERLPGGTIVIEKNRREIAIGTILAKSILVTFTGSDAHHGGPRKRRRHGFGRTE
jgi:Fe2+ transport system protein FeoA